MKLKMSVQIILKAAQHDKNITKENDLLEIAHLKYATTATTCSFLRRMWTSPWLLSIISKYSE